jgi:hypothetical protein
MGTVLMAFLYKFPSYRKTMRTVPMLLSLKLIGYILLLLLIIIIIIIMVFVLSRGRECYFG